MSTWDSVALTAPPARCERDALSDWLALAAHDPSLFGPALLPTLRALHRRGIFIRDSDLAAVLPPGNWAALWTGLSDADNERLATTTDVDEVVALVLRGLHTVAPTTMEGGP